MIAKKRERSPARGSGRRAQRESHAGDVGGILTSLKSKLSASEWLDFERLVIASHLWTSAEVEDVIESMGDDQLERLAQHFIFCASEVGQADPDRVIQRRRLKDKKASLASTNTQRVIEAVADPIFKLGQWWEQARRTKRDRIGESLDEIGRLAAMNLGADKIAESIPGIKDGKSLRSQLSKRGLTVAMLRDRHKSPSKK